MAWYNTSWLSRKKITVQAAYVKENVANFSVMFNLANFGNDFWDNINSDGGDIRVTNGNEVTELARHISEIDVVNKKGILYFKADTLSTSINKDFYIYYNNPAASNYSMSATYGTANTYQHNSCYCAYNFTANTSIADLTNQNKTLTAYNSPTLAESPIGKALSFNGINQYAKQVNGGTSQTQCMNHILKINSSGGFFSGINPLTGQGWGNRNYVDANRRIIFDKEYSSNLATPNNTINYGDYCMLTLRTWYSPAKSSIFLNGVEVATDNIYRASNNYLIIAAVMYWPPPGQVTGFCNMEIAQFRSYATPFTDLSIMTLYNNLLQNNLFWGISTTKRRIMIF